MPKIFRLIQKNLNMDVIISALGKWGRMQMGGGDGFNRILTRFYFFSPVGVRLVPLKTRKHMISRDFDRILTGL